MLLDSVRCPNCGSDSIFRVFRTPFQFEVPAPRDTLEIKVFRGTETAKLPTRTHDGDEDIGWDLYADVRYDFAQRPINTPWRIPPYGVRAIATGLHIELPSGWGAFLKSRSSLGNKNTDIYGGVQDRGYRGEYLIPIHNSNDSPIFINPGERVAQLVLIPNPNSAIIEVAKLEDLSPSLRGGKGFGSSGK